MRAASIGAGVPAWLVPGARIAVHSVFARALNLEVRTGGRSSLIVILPDGAPRVPNGVHLDAGVGVLDGGLRRPVGQAGWFGGGWLELPGLAIAIQAAPIWSAGLVARATVDLAVVTRARAYLPALPGPIALAPGLAEALVAALAAAKAGTIGDAALAAAKARAIGDAALALAGLGPGLTPTGDDVLLGCHAVLAAGGHPAAGPLGDALAACADRTTAVSAALLRLAALGEHAELTADLARRLVAGNALAARAAMARLFRHGATSGRDTAAGALLGCRVLLSGFRAAGSAGTERAA